VSSGRGRARRPAEGAGWGAASLGLSLIERTAPPAATMCEMRGDVLIEIKDPDQARRAPGML
jgi:hypothetical protein